MTKKMKIPKLLESSAIVAGVFLGQVATAFGGYCVNWETMVCKAAGTLEDVQTYCGLADLSWNSAYLDYCKGGKSEGFERCDPYLQTCEWAVLVVFDNPLCRPMTIPNGLAVETGWVAGESCGPT